MKERPDFAALEEQIRRGREAQMQIADWYDSLTPEELVEEFDQGHPVTLQAPPEGLRMTFEVSFSQGELDGVLKAASAAQKTTGSWIHDLAVTYSTRCPRCGGLIPEDDDEAGTGPVYWTRSAAPFCSMECVVIRERRWLKEQR